MNQPTRALPPLRELGPTVVLVAILAGTPAVSVQAAAWSERLEPLPWLALAGVVAGLVVGRSKSRAAPSAVAGLLSGLMVVSFLYASFLPQRGFPERFRAFVSRVADWLGAAFSGAASTDNLLFAYTMGLLAWAIGYVGAWFAARYLNPWWVIVASGSALLLNLSYAPPDLLPLVFVHLVVSFLLLINLNALGKVSRWRAEAVDFGFQQGTGFAVSSAAVAIVIVLCAWRLPVGEVRRDVAAAWERVSGPWQTIQTNFDRMFASLNPSPLSGRGLTVSQTMAPRGAFELGDAPVMRVAGREPAYWRAVTYDRYTGQVMTTSATTQQRLDRRQPIDGSMEVDQARRFVEYTVTLLAPSSSVIYAPDVPMTVSLPTVYEYRADLRDYSSLRPVVPVREQQRYNLLASISTASVSELRQAGTIYPGWAQSYRQLPPGLPDAVRQESWRVVGDATNVYDAASRIEHYLRTFRYSTRVRVPPADRDWVSFLLFESKEGYCDYFATAMTIMLRSVGIPARVASGYVTGDWDPATQSYLVTERHAHTWSEVYFPKYGWVSFEPSAIRSGVTRLENPLVPLSDEDLLRALESDFGADDFLYDEDEFDTGSLLALPASQERLGPPPLVVLLGFLVVLLAVGSVAVAVLWFRGMRGLPVIARSYAQVVRLATWCGAGPRRGQTPYEYTSDLARVVPAAKEPLSEIVEAYVEGTYGERPPEPAIISRVLAAGAEARTLLLRSLAIGRGQAWLSRRLRELAGPARRI